MIQNALTLAPRIPAEIKMLDYNFTIKNCLIHASYVSGKTVKYRYEFGKINPNVKVDVFPYELKQIQIPENTILQLEATGKNLTITVINHQGKIIYNTISPESISRLAKQNESNRIMENVQFASPIGIGNHPVIKTH